MNGAVKKLLFFPVFAIIACLVAGLYGIIHNQISYTVAPSYFHEFKFIQFNIPLEERTRMSASKIGFLASWFMGLLISLPIYIACATLLKGNEFYRTLFKTILIVVLTTLVVGLCALIYAYINITADNLPFWTNGRSLTTPLEFARAGTMHNFSYTGGMIGILSGLFFVLWRWHKVRKMQNHGLL